jgi:arylsulfatase A-like enzyme
MINRRSFLASGAALWQLPKPRRRPNVVFILTDDQGLDTIRCYGNNVLTPNIDRLAREGVKFTQAYAATAVCTPSRYTCLTGRYAGRCTSEQFLKPNPQGTQSHIGWNTALETDGWNIGRALQAGGYATGVVGKWHVGGVSRGQRTYKPDDSLADPETNRLLAEDQARLINWVRARGFDYAASMYGGNLADYKLKALNAHNVEWIVKGALDFIDRYKEQPFFLYMATTVPHSPNPLLSLTADPRITSAGLLRDVPEVMPPRAALAERLRKAGVPEKMAAYTWLDDGVGAVLQKLERLNLLDDTAIVFFSDNGPTPGKGTCFQKGVHLPFIMRWKGHLPAATRCKELVQNIDFVPTILDICGVTPPREMQMDGRSLLPVAAGNGKAWRDALFFEIGHARAVLSGKWKYVAIRYPPELRKRIKDGTLGRPAYQVDAALDLQEIAAAAYPCYFDADQLYDVESDPDEKRNLAADLRYSGTVATMKKRLEGWLQTFPGRPFGEFVA